MIDQKRLKPGMIIRRFDSGKDEIVFRYLRKEDLPQALEYINSLTKEKCFIGMQKEQTPEQESVWISASLKEMKEGRGVTIVAEINGRFMGSASVKRKPLDANSHVCTIGIGLHSDFRGKGVGTEIMNTLIQQGRDVLKCSIAELSVYEPNAAAKRLYEKSGFAVTGRIPDGCNYYGKLYDEIIMVRKL